MRKLLSLSNSDPFLTGELFAQKTITGRVTDEATSLPMDPLRLRDHYRYCNERRRKLTLLNVPASANQLEISAVGYRVDN